MNLFRAFGLPDPVEEYRFAPPRRWRFDYAWPDLRLALEVEGGVWTGGRHVSGMGFVRDMEKYNAAAVAGWRVLRCQPKDLRKSAIYELLAEAMKDEPKKRAAPADTGAALTRRLSGWRDRPRARHTLEAMVR